MGTRTRALVLECSIYNMKNFEMYIKALFSLLA